jgi:Ca-activated chloride channel family protein
MQKRILAVAVLLLALGGVVLSQDEQAPARLSVNVVSVPLIVTVTDNKGALITGLKKEDFKIFEDERLQKTDTFVHEADLPLSIALLVDISSSTFSQLGFERAAAKDFFAKVVKARKDRAAIIGFDNKPRLMADFTDDLEKLNEGLKKLDAGGGTGMYDAIFQTAETRLSREAGERRKVVIVISDGYDTASAYSLQEATQMIQKHDVLLYGISVNEIADTKGNEKKEGDRALQHLADETGGKVYHPRKLEDLGAEFQKIEQELRSQYVLSYTPQNALNGTSRKIRVELSNKKLVAHTRKTYIASR